jgi:hypothetical protein
MALDSSFTATKVSIKKQLCHAVSSETGMPVQRLLSLVETDDGLKVRVRWRGLGETEDTWEPVDFVYADVPLLFKKLLARNTAPSDLVKEAKDQLGIHN